MSREADPSATPDPLEVEVVARAMWEAEPIVYGWEDQDRRTLNKWDDAVVAGLYGVSVYRQFAAAALRALDTYRASKRADHGR